MRVRPTTWKLLPLLLVVACGSGGAESDKASTSSGAGRGVIVGTVKLEPGAVLPEYAGVDAALRTLLPGAVRDRPECPDPRGALQPVVATPDGLLGGLVVAASDFTGGFTRPPRTHDIVIRRCRLEPTLVDATRGDKLRLRNLDDVNYAPSFGPASEEHPMPRDEPVMIALGGPGVESILCPLSAPCGRTDVVTLNHPLHARTDANGRFRIEGFPVGQRVRLSAWHPLFEETSTHVWLERGETRRVDLVIAPRE